LTFGELSFSEILPTPNMDIGTGHNYSDKFRLTLACGHITRVAFHLTWIQGNPRASPFHCESQSITISSSADLLSSFVSLLHDISQIPPQKSRHPRWCDSEKGRVPYPALNILHRWIAKLHNRYAPLQPNTTLTFFRLLFPEEDVGRKYGLQEVNNTFSDNFCV